MNDMYERLTLYSRSLPELLPQKTQSACRQAGASFRASRLELPQVGSLTSEAGSLLVLLLPFEADDAVVPSGDIFVCELNSCERG